MAKRRARAGDIPKDYAGELIRNKHGTVFTAEEKAALAAAVEKANEKAVKMREIFDAQDYRIDGKPTGATVGDMWAMGKEYDFSIREKTADINRFKSRDDFAFYMRNLERIDSGDYVRDRARQYKRNYEKSLLDPASGMGYAYDDVSDILMKIRMMKPEEYLKRVASNEELEIHFNYTKEQEGDHLNKIRRALGLKERDEDGFWYDGYF